MIDLESSGLAERFGRLAVRLALLEIPAEAQARAFGSTAPAAWAARVEYARRSVAVAYKIAGQTPTDPILEMEALALVREVELAWLSELLTFIGNRALTPGSGSDRLWRCQYAKR